MIRLQEIMFFIRNFKFQFKVFSLASKYRFKWTIKFQTSKINLKVLLNEKLETFHLNEKPYALDQTSGTSSNFSKKLIVCCYYEMKGEKAFKLHTNLQKEINKR